RIERGFGEPAANHRGRVRVRACVHGSSTREASDGSARTTWYVRTMKRPVPSLLALASRAEDLALFRAEALAIVRQAIPFDAAIFHEFSPRSPLSRAALVGLPERKVEASRARWDENAVLFGRIRD